MNKLLNVNTLVISLLFVVLAALIYVNHQVSAQNQALHQEVNQLKKQVLQVKTSSNQVQSRLDSIEQQLQPGLHPLLADANLQ